MKILYAPQFAEMLGGLPQDIQRFFRRQEEILKENWRDPRLHIKQMRGRPITFSFRITRSYRAFFYFRSAEEVTLYAIGHRKDIERKLH